MAGCRTGLKHSQRSQSQTAIPQLGGGRHQSHFPSLSFQVLIPLRSPLTSLYGYLDFFLPIFNSRPSLLLDIFFCLLGAITVPRRLDTLLRSSMSKKCHSAQDNPRTNHGRLGPSDVMGGVCPPCVPRHTHSLKKEKRKGVFCCSSPLTRD